MNLFEKISILGPSAQYDTCGPKDFGKTTDIPGVYHAKVGGKNICRLFKVLQTNECSNNCNYCAFRRDRECPRTSATPDEMASAFDSAYSRRLVDGLFLSSGLSGHPDFVMDRMIGTAEVLRNRFNYKGYLHLKVMPGSSDAAIAEAIKFANRISLNIESPTEEDLLALSPQKSLKKSFFTTLSKIKTELFKRKTAVGKAPSLTTQFVVGAGKEKDLDIIKMTKFLYDKFDMKRIFYSAFRPVSDTPLQDHQPASLTREHRLYQVDFLMRFYSFLPEEIPLDNTGNLIEVSDPKMLWAQQHPDYYPINLNTAHYNELIRVPGIGPVSAKKIMKLRKQSIIKSLYNLQGMRLQIDKMSKYICV